MSSPGFHHKVRALLACLTCLADCYSNELKVTGVSLESALQYGGSLVRVHGVGLTGVDLCVLR